MARGNRRGWIFSDDGDHQTFLRMWGEACVRSGLLVNAWVSFRIRVAPLGAFARCRMSLDDLFYLWFAGMKVDHFLGSVVKEGPYHRVS